MFGYQEIKKYPVLGNSRCLSNGVSLRLSNKLTASYAYNWEVWIQGVRVGNLATDCRLPQSNVMQRFTFKNSVLYAEPSWYHYLSVIEAATGLRCSSIGLLELALDMQPQNLDSAADAYGILRTLDGIYKYLPRKYNDDVRFTPMQGKLQVQESHGTYYFGGPVTSPKSSGKQIAVYCKSDEIRHSGKNYISEFHQKNGLDVERPILRIEARLNSKYLRRKAPLTERDLLKPELLESVFTTAIGHSFKFRDLHDSARDEHRNIKYAIVELIAFDFLSQRQTIRPEPLIQDENSDKTNLCTVKRLTFELIRHNAPETSAELSRFIQTNPAPKGQKWASKIKHYTQQYPGSPSMEQMIRIENLFRYLSC